MIHRVKCTAKAKSTQKTCRRWSEPSSDKCKFHGGRALKGPAAPAYRTGEYSKFLPIRYVEAYERSLRDPTMLALRNQIALCDAREEELLKQLDTGESGAVWIRLMMVKDKIDSARRRNDLTALGALMPELFKVIEEGATQREAWDEIRDNMVTRRQLVDTERKRIESTRAYITAEQLTLVAAKYADLARKFIDDPRTLSRFVAELRSLSEGALVEPIEIKRIN